MSLVLRAVIPLLFVLAIASPAHAIRVAVDFSDPDNPQMKTLSGYCDLNGDQCDQTRWLPWNVDFEGDFAKPTNQMVVLGNGQLYFAGDEFYTTPQYQYVGYGQLQAGRNESSLIYNGEFVYEQAARVQYDGDAVIVTWFTCYTPKNCFNLPYSARMEPGMTDGVSELVVTIDYTGLPSNFFGFSDKEDFAFLSGGPNFMFQDINPHPGTLVLRVPAIFTETPEPSTWAMMIMGFGGVGSILRRRPRPVSA